MKKLYLLCTIIFVIGCSSKKAVQSKNVSFIYEAALKNDSLRVLVDHKNTVVSQFMSGEGRSSNGPTKNEDWEELNGMITNLNVRKLKDLTTPKDRVYIKEPMKAVFKIAVNNTIYKTQEFDDGNPPVEIEAIVAKLLNIHTTQIERIQLTH
ncbi:hypothetical protein [Flavobacterium sp. NRK1]|uniref:hypothetical protein n=1 Tax=Flavobacterium sp. NRK1 TaxID=2954929 RepID=UPI002092A464|nr:hypothetical protein [Flavobacterium sp. NRK1]MCO6147589.1 hypothetical protein [Flavobacterium sp. NRK1]